MPSLFFHFKDMKHLILLASLLLLASCGGRTTGKGGGTGNAGITFADTLCDFPPFGPEDAVQRHTFVFTNTGRVPAAVVDVRLSCGCLSADHTRGIVQPGDTGHVTVVYDGRRTPPGHFDKSVRVRFNSPRVHVLRVRGEMRQTPPSTRSGQAAG